MAAIIVDRVWSIYKVTCLVTNKSYVGLTVETVKQRWSNHVSYALRQYGRSILHRAIRKYGRDAFSVETIETATNLATASALEQIYIAADNTRCPHGYNITIGGMGTPGFRKRHSMTTRAKMSASAKGKPKSLEARQNMSEAWKSRVITEQARQNMAKGQLGRILSKECRENIAAAARGRQFPKRSIAMLRTPKKHAIYSVSGVRGVIPEGKRWTARIGINGKRVHIGVFDTKEEAAAAYSAVVEKRIAELAATQ